MKFGTISNPFSDVAIFRVDAYIHTHVELRRKLLPKSEKGIMMGYPTTNNALLRCKSLHRVKICDVIIFIEF